MMLYEDCMLVCIEFIFGELRCCNERSFSNYSLEWVWVIPEKSVNIKTKELINRLNGTYNLVFLNRNVTVLRFGLFSFR